MFDESARHFPGSEPALGSFGQFFSDEVAAIYRAALQKPSLQSGYFEFCRINDVIEKTLLNEVPFGSASDVPLLRASSVYLKIGPLAIQAIKEIEEAPRQMKLRANS